MSNKHLEEFLAHSLELESEARERYLELAEAMAEHHNAEVSEFFARMAEESRLHLEEVTELAEGMSLPDLKAWEFDWPEEESPEAASYEAVHYRMDMRQALELALANEREAGAFYGQVAESALDPDTIKLAKLYADEEAEHARRLEERLAELPPTAVTQFEDDDPAHSPE